MTITVPDHLAAAVADRVSTGQYPTADAVLGAALAALAEWERQAAHLEWLRAELAKGEADADAGRVKELDDAAVADLKRRVADRLARDGG